MPKKPPGLGLDFAKNLPPEYAQILNEYFINLGSIMKVKCLLNID